MELRRQLAFLRESLPLVLASLFLAAVTAFVVSQVLPPSYEARVIVAVGQSAGGGSGDLNSLQVSQRLSQTYAALAVTNVAARDVIDELRLDTTPERLLEHVRAEAPLESTLLTITVDALSGEEAARIANAFAARMVRLEVTAGDDALAKLRAFIDGDLDAVRAQITSTQQRIDELDAIVAPTAAQTAELIALEGQIATLRSTFATLVQLSTTGGSANQLSIADPATVPPEPVSPRVLVNVVLGALLGAVLGIGFAYARQRLDDTVRSPEELEHATNTPVLGTIVRMPGDAKRPLMYRLATLLYPRSPAAEGFRHLRTGIEFASNDTGLKLLLVTSAMPGDGKTTCAANLAVAFAQAGHSVCLVDADLRKPALHEVFGLPNLTGLSDLLRGDESTFEAATHPTEVTGLRILTSGLVPPNPAELVASPRMRAVLTSITGEVDLVILDSPPLQAVTDAAILASLAGGTILVAAAGKTRRALIVRARDTLARVGANVLGTALNGIDERDGKDAAFGYFSYYGEPDTREAPPAARPVESAEPREA